MLPWLSLARGNKRALLAKVHREEKRTQHFQSSNSTLGLPVLEGPRMSIFFHLVVEPPDLVLLWVWFLPHRLRHCRRHSHHWPPPGTLRGIGSWMMIFFLKEAVKKVSKSTQQLGQTPDPGWVAPMLQGAGEVLGDEGLLDQHAPGGDGPGPGSPSPPGACWSRRPSSPRTSPAPCSIGATQVVGIQEYLFLQKAPHHVSLCEGNRICNHPIIIGLLLLDLHVLNPILKASSRGRGNNHCIDCSCRRWGLERCRQIRSHRLRFHQARTTGFARHRLRTRVGRLHLCLRSRTKSRRDTLQGLCILLFIGCHLSSFFGGSLHELNWSRSRHRSKRDEGECEKRVVFFWSQWSQVRLSQNGDILLKGTLHPYSCFPASFPNKMKK